MRRVLVTATLVTFTIAPLARAQWGGFGGRGGRMGGDPMGREAPAAPRLPGPELDGPADSGLAQGLLDLNAVQAARYAQAYDSFMVATRPQRDSARVATEKMNDRLASGDRAAALFYAERLQDLGKYLKDRQDKFEDSLRHFLTADQVKTYRRWKEDEERAAEAKRREDALRWRQAAFGGGERMAAMPEQKTLLASVTGVARPDLGSQAVRVGRTVYVASQLALDSGGALVGTGDLKVQAERAFANVAAVLRAAGGAPQDVVALTIYVVNYRPGQLATIRDAAAAYLGPNAPVATVLGVQSLARDGALVAVAATAVTGASGFARASPRER